MERRENDRKEKRRSKRATHKKKKMSWSLFNQKKKKKWAVPSPSIYKSLKISFLLPQDE